MLPGVDGVTGLWAGGHCLLRDSPGGPAVRPPGPFPGLQRSGWWNTDLLLYNWGVTRDKISFILFLIISGVTGTLRLLMAAAHLSLYWDLWVSFLEAFWLLLLSIFAKNMDKRLKTCVLSYWSTDIPIWQNKFLCQQ